MTPALSPGQLALLTIGACIAALALAYALGHSHGFAKAMRHRLARRLGETLQDARACPRPDRRMVEPTPSPVLEIDGPVTARQMERFRWEHPRPVKEQWPRSDGELESSALPAARPRGLAAGRQAGIQEARTAEDRTGNG